MHDDVDDLLEGLADDLGAPLVLLDAAYSVVAFTPHSVDADPSRAGVILRGSPRESVRRGLDEAGVRDARGPVRTPAVPGVPLRILLPLRVDDELLGFVSWLDENDDAQVQRAVRSPRVPAIARVLHARGASDDHADLTRRLIAGQVSVEDSATELREAGLTPDAPCRAVSVRADGTVPTVAAELLPGALSAQVDGLLAFIVADDVALDALRERLGIAVGVGPAVAVASLATSWRQAVLASRIAARGDTEHGSFVRWGDLGVERLLARIPLELVTRDDLPTSVRMLLADPRGLDLADTLLAYLDRGGDAVAVARSRGIARSTVYHRLDRASTVCGVKLDDGSARLDLHAGLRIAQFAGLLD